MKLGIFKVSQEFINQNNGELCKSFGYFGITPIEIHRDMYTNQLIYKCIGDCFDDVEEGYVIPNYNITFNKEGYDLSRC